VITHRNRRGDRYYLHKGKTKTGKPKYFFSRKREGMLAASIPDGFEVYESPNALVLLRRVVPCLVTSKEAALVSDAVRQNPKAKGAIVDTKGDTIAVHMPSFDLGESVDELTADYPFTDRAQLLGVLKRSVHYTPTMRFVLQDKRTREYQTERWCYSGSIDDWIPVESPGPLPKLARKLCRHLARESCFELM
jgi:hypothetical protein